MALIKCIECGKEISSHSKKCIYCGTKVEKNNHGNNNNLKVSLFIILGFIILIIFVYNYLAYRNTKNSNATFSNTKVDNSDIIVNSHDEDLKILKYEIEESTEEYFHLIFYIENETDNNIIFESISITELDIERNIIDDYRSCNKNYMPSELTPGQSLKLSLTFEKEGLDAVTVKRYSFYDTNNNLIEKDFAEELLIKIPY